MTGDRTYRSTAVDSNGIRVTTTIVVPESASWDDVRECGELAQMGTTSTSALVTKCRTEFSERCPF